MKENAGQTSESHRTVRIIKITLIFRESLLLLKAPLNYTVVQDVAPSFSLEMIGR